MSISVRSRIPWPPRIRSREPAETQLPRPVPWGSRPAVRTPQPCAVLWQHVEGGRPASAACRLIMARTTRRVNARSAFPRPGHALERVADSRTAPAVGNRDRRRSAHPHDRAVPAGTTSAPAGRDDGRDARCPSRTLGLQVVAARAGRSSSTTGSAARPRAWSVGLAGDGRPRFNAWLDQPPHATRPPPVTPLADRRRAALARSTSCSAAASTAGRRRDG